MYTLVYIPTKTMGEREKGYNMLNIKKDRDE